MDFVSFQGCPPKLTCPLKGDYFNSKCIFQLPTIDFHVTFVRFPEVAARVDRAFWGEPTLRVGNGWVGPYNPVDVQLSFFFFPGGTVCMSFFQHLQRGAVLKP